MPKEIQQCCSPEGWGQQRSFSDPPSSNGLLSAAGWAKMNLQLWVGLPRHPAGAAPACISILWHPQRPFFSFFSNNCPCGDSRFGGPYLLFVILALYCGSCCFTLYPDVLPPGPKVLFLYFLPVDKLTGGNGKQTILGSSQNTSCIPKKPW